MELARPQADAAKIRVNVDQQAEGVEVRVDRDLLKQAVLNVVVNAIEAMPEGGELRFEAFGRARTRPRSASPIRAPGSRRELRDKIFRLYFTTTQGRLRHRPGHDFPDRATPRWYNRLHQRTGQGHDLLDPPADCGLIEARGNETRRSSTSLAILASACHLMSGCVLHRQTARRVRGASAAQAGSRRRPPAASSDSRSPLPQTHVELARPAADQRRKRWPRTIAARRNRRRRHPRRPEANSSPSPRPADTSATGRRDTRAGARRRPLPPRRAAVLPIQEIIPARGDEASAGRSGRDRQEEIRAAHRTAAAPQPDKAAEGAGVTQSFLRLS